MLVHHDARAYAPAASEAASFARSKLGKLIEQGKGRAGAVLERVLNVQPVDRLVRARVLDFRSDEDGVQVAFGLENEEGLHPHALQQASSKVGLPWTYVQALQQQERQPWGAELLSENLNKLYARLSAPKDDRFLLRTVDGEVRGFLSDRFRRLDSRPIVEAFATACDKVGALPVDGHASDTRISIEALLPEVYEPVPDEIMCFGVLLENSDFGAAALSVRVFCLRLWCTNKAVAKDGIREVHLGRKLTDDVAWSDQTHALDTAATASAVRDVVEGQLGTQRINEFQNVIRAAHEQKVDPRQVGALLRKGLSKAEVEKVTEAFNGPDVEMLPCGSTLWRLSNAVSWVAGHTADGDRKLDLAKFAGALLPAAA